VKPYAQEAENLRLLFISGLVSADEAVARADRTLLALPIYDDDLATISLGAPLSIYYARLMINLKGK
jgi:hypothetical protein